MKTAWVLCGGGSRGAYEIGVWQTFRPAGMMPDIVTGTSIGALNGALIVQQDYEAALDLWENLRIDDVMKDGIDLELSAIMENKQKIAPFLKKYVNAKGADNTPLKDRIARLVDEPKLRQSPIDFGLVTVRYPSLQAVELTKQEIPQGQIKDYLIASASCFPAFPVYEFAGQQYIDGGYQDNLPIALALRMGAERVIAVNLHYQSPIHPTLEKLPQVKVLSPSRDLGSFLSFDPMILKRNRELGVLDAQKFLGQRIGERYVFTPLTPSLQTLAEVLVRELTLFQCQLDDSDHPFIDTLWPQNVLLDKILKAPGDSFETLFVRMMELAAELMKKEAQTLLDPQTFLIEAAEFFSAGSPALETERSLYQSLLQQTTRQSLLTLIGKADRILLCRSLCDQMLHRQNSLLQQLHWLAPMMAQEVLVSWFAVFLIRWFKLSRNSEPHPKKNA